MSFPFSTPQPPPGGRPSQEKLYPTQVKVKCYHCGEPCVRNEASGLWVHEADQIVIVGGSIMQTWDHQAEPDIIETEGRPA